MCFQQLTEIPVISLRPQIGLHNSYTLCYLGRRRWPTTPSWAARFTSISEITVVSGSAPHISPVRIVWVSTKEKTLAKAKDFAEGWYLELRGKHRRGEITAEKTFRQAADQFLREFEIITGGDRNAVYVEGHRARLRVHLLPFFGHMGLSEITAGQVQENRIHRHEKGVAERGKPPARSTLHQEIVVLRQVLKTAARHGWLQTLPDLSQPYKTSGKVSHRAWFSPEEYKQLYEATRRRARKPKRERYRWHAEQLHDYVLFMANTGLRPDEARRLEYRDPLSWPHLPAERLKTAALERFLGSDDSGVARNRSVRCAALMRA